MRNFQKATKPVYGTGLFEVMERVGYAVGRDAYGNWHTRLNVEIEDDGLMAIGRVEWEDDPSVEDEWLTYTMRLWEQIGWADGLTPDSQALEFLVQHQSESVLSDIIYQLFENDEK